MTSTSTSTSTSNAPLRASKQSAADSIQQSAVEAIQPDAYDEGVKFAQAALATRPGPLKLMDEYGGADIHSAFAKGWNSICAGEENRGRSTEQTHN